MTERRVHVLLVEDDESLRPILVRHLAPKGFRVAEAASAEAAADQLADGLRPALVLLDLNLPGETGWDFLRGAALAEAGRPARRGDDGDHRQPEAAPRARTSRATCPSRSRWRRSWRPSSGSWGRGRDATSSRSSRSWLAAFVALGGLVWLCEAVRS